MTVVFLMRKWVSLRCVAAEGLWEGEGGGWGEDVVQNTSPSTRSVNIAMPSSGFQRAKQAERSFPHHPDTEQAARSMIMSNACAKLQVFGES